MTKILADNLEVSELLDSAERDDKSGNEPFCQIVLHSNLL